MKYLQIFFLCILLFTNCGEMKEETPTKKVSSNSTEEMAKELAELVKNGDPKLYYHWNSKRAELAKEELLKANNQTFVNLTYKYLSEVLNAGDSELAVHDLNALMAKAQLTKQNYTSNHKPIYDLLALSYLRLGEQKNCIVNHNAQSCIVPIQAKGQHLDKMGSEKAMEIYAFLLDKEPEDLNYRWLYNLAAMTLGQYPDEVDKKYLLNLPDQKNTQKLKDIAMSVGLAQNGLSGGVCMDDFNNDGLLDIICTSYGMEDQMQYFENLGNGMFENKTSQSGIEGIVGGLNCIHADYDGDGYKDIFVLRGGWLSVAGLHPNSLLKNMGNGTFQDVTYAAGLKSKIPTQTAVFFDYDNDGNIDLFIGNEANKTNLSKSELYRNNGDGTFTETAEQAGVAVIGFVKGVTAGDYDNDGWQDIYVSQMGTANLLYRNLGNGKFEEVSKTAGVFEPIYSFPTWFFDVNNDGWLDLFVGSYDSRNQEAAAFDFAAECLGKSAREEQSRLYINQKNGTFKDESISMHLRKSMYAMGSNFGDVDMDGYLDIYIGTGTPNLGSVTPNRMFRNVEGKDYEDISFSSGTGHIQKGHGIVFGDLNNDGDQEIYTVLGGAFEGDVFNNALFDGEESDNNFLKLYLVGSNGNKDAIGARIKIVTDMGEYHRVTSTGGSFGSNPLRSEIGLGNSEVIKLIEIKWPDKAHTVSSFKDLQPNLSYIINQLDNTIEIKPEKSFEYSKDEHHHH